MTLATATRKSPVVDNAALFACIACEGWHIASGYASAWQVHRPCADDFVKCDGCGRRRPLLIEGEAIPISVRRWPDLPTGFKIAGGLTIIDRREASA